MKADTTIPTEERPALVEGARIAQEPIQDGFWERVANYFEGQRGLVTPRETLDKQSPTKDY